MTAIQCFSIIHETTPNPLLSIVLFFYGKGFVVQNVFVTFLVPHFLLVNAVVKESQ